MNKGFARRDRVAEEIRRQLAELIRLELKDPRVHMVTLTDVELSPDYAHAKVFYTSLAGSEHAAEISAGLAHAAGFLRRELGRSLHIHTLPQLHFTFDESVERGSRLSQLIAQANRAETPTDDAED